MRIGEAKAALERAGYVVREAVRIESTGEALYDVEGLTENASEGVLIQLAHRHGAWPPAFERAHSAGPGDFS